MGSHSQREPSTKGLVRHQVRVDARAEPQRCRSADGDPTSSSSAAAHSPLTAVAHLTRIAVAPSVPTSGTATASLAGGG